MTAAQLVALHEREPAEIVHPVLLIRINRLFRPGASQQELYDATRGVWRLGKRRELVEYALSVYDGIVQEVYAICGWYPAGSTLSSRGPLEREGRFEFVGAIANESVRSRYRLKSVDHLLSPGNQNPVSYVNVPEC